MEVVTNIKEYYWSKHDECRKLSDEYYAKANEADAKGDFEGWRINSLRSLEYLDKCYEMLEKIRGLNMDTIESLLSKGS